MRTTVISQNAERKTAMITLVVDGERGRKRSYTHHCRVVGEDRYRGWLLDEDKTRLTQLHQEAEKEAKGLNWLRRRLDLPGQQAKAPSPNLLFVFESGRDMEKPYQFHVQTEARKLQGAILWLRAEAEPLALQAEIWDAAAQKEIETRLAATR